MSGPQSFQDSRRPLPEDLDAIIDKSEAFILKKHDQTTTVGVLNGKDFGLEQDLLLKRFNYRGLFDFTFRTLFFSRARRLWNINQRLFARGLPVPRPVCYIGPSFHQKNSFFISSVIEDSLNLGYMYKQGLIQNPEMLAQILAKAISAWHISGAVHGDLKWSNIMVQKRAELTNIFFIDLDQTKLYSTPNIRGIIRDLARFYRYGLELGAEEWVNSQFFPAYDKLLPAALMNMIDLDFVREKAYKKMEIKRRRKLS